MDSIILVTYSRAKLTADFGELGLSAPQNSFQLPNNRLQALIFFDLFIQNVLRAPQAFLKRQIVLRKEHQTCVNMLRVKYKPLLEQISTMIGTIFADPEIPIWARLHPHDHRFSSIHVRDGDKIFRIRKVGTDWWAEIKVNLKFRSGLIAYKNCSGVCYIQQTASSLRMNSICKAIALVL